MRLPDDPSILVLLVATDGEPWLPEVLKGLRAQHGTFRVIAVDNASTDGSLRILRKAFGDDRVIGLERRVGYGRALAAALHIASEREFEADAILLLHDDTALRAGALDAMVDALRGDGVGLVGAKLVEWDDERVLQDIGRTTDRYGRIVERVEKGELDQGQHEGVHEVLYATSAALLVATEVIEKVGLFDLRYVALRDDLDLCWRARLAGYRTVVTSAGAARHAAATVRDQRPGPVRRRVRYFGDRNMIATLIKNYSARRLLVALPVTLLVSVVNAVLYTARGRRSAASQVLQALRWNLTHLPSTLRARRRAQSGRAVSDAEVAGLMHHGATRVRAQVERAVEAVMGEIEEITDEDFEAPPERLIDHVRAHPTAVAVTLAVIVGLLGARPLLGAGSVAGLDMPPWPSGFTAFFQEYASGWRGAGAGGAGPATPGLALLGLLTFLCFGSGWLAQRLLLFGLPLLGAAGVVRLCRTLGIGTAGRRIAGVVYLSSPLVLGTFGDGRLPDLVLAAAAPMLLIPLLRAARVLPRRGWRSVAAGTAGTAVAASLSPWTLVFVAGAAAVLAVRAIGSPRFGVIARAGLGMAGGAAVLLMPWTIELFRPGSPMMGGGPGPARSMIDLLALSPGSARPVPLALGLGILLAGVAGGLVAPKRLRAAVRTLAALAAVGTGVAWIVARGVPFIAPRPTLPLIALAVAMPVLGAVGFEVAASSLGRRTFGRIHVVAGAIGLLLVVQVVSSAVWVAGGNRPGLVSADSLALASLSEEAGEMGAFRVLWIGGTIERPTASITGPGGDTMRRYLVRRAGAGHEALAAIVASTMAGTTHHAGRALATFGVRYVVVRPESDQGVRRAIAAQPDLAFVQRLRPEGESESLGSEDSLASGALVYRNNVGLPLAPSLAATGWVRASAEGMDGLALAEPRPRVLGALDGPQPGLYRGATGKGSVLLLGEDFSADWRARVGERDVSPDPSFGWATRFRLEAGGGEAVVWFAGQRWHRGAILLNVLLVAAFLIWRSQRLARDRGER